MVGYISYTRLKCLKVFGARSAPWGEGQAFHPYMEHKVPIIKLRLSGRRLKAAIRVNDHSWQALAGADEFPDRLGGLWDHAGAHQPPLALAPAAQEFGSAVPVLGSPLAA